AIEKQRMEDELAIARDIQQGLLPRTLPEIPEFEIQAINIPSKQVGGDYYDVIQRSENEVVIAIGDVSGKGTPASLLMANVQAALRALTPMGLSLPETTARINDLTSKNTSSGRFITFFWGSLDVPTRVFRYVNAGHNFPFLLRANGTLERLEVGGIILGMMPTMVPYEEGSTTLQQGDMLVLFTDGVSEAMSAEGLDYTEERLEKILLQIRTLSAREVIDKITSDLTTYTQGTPQSDDITMLVVKVL
ncbi:MAG: PP2C family protein-serine/threonine phosphatase, partial [Nitrososphaera sp.]|nr:PP2C family protein-serine/threonine phosphatase [Nitrososphaera sp.]